MIKILEDDELDDDLFYEDGTPYKKEEPKAPEDVKVKGFEDLIEINKQLLSEMKEMHKPKPKKSWVAVPIRKDGQIIKVNIQEN